MFSDDTAKRKCIFLGEKQISQILRVHHPSKHFYDLLWLATFHSAIITDHFTTVIKLLEGCSTDEARFVSSQKGKSCCHYVFQC